MSSSIAINYVLSVIVLVNCGNALPASMEKMTVSRMRMADLETSATGYVYNHQPGRPASYAQYSNHGTGGYYHAPTPIQYVTYQKPEVILPSRPTVINALPAYKREVPVLPPGYVVPLLQAPTNPALAPYYVPTNIQGKAAHFEQANGDDDDNDSRERTSGEEENVDSKEEQGGGKNFNAEEHSSHGENGKESYSNHHQFNNGASGEHSKDRHEGYYSDDGGNEKSHTDSSGHYGNFDESSKGNEGESHGDEKYHKKGHKTTGFHNVYHKDEYKKDTDFYDEDHKSGHYDKNSSTGQHHSSADGGYKKGQSHDSGHEDHKNGKSGHYEKGRESSHQKGNKSKEGTDSYHKNYSDYAAKSEVEDGKKYGYDSGH